MRKPTPELVIAVLALFVALAGTANAVVDAAVPLARRALVAREREEAERPNGERGSPRSPDLPAPPQESSRPEPRMF